MNSDDNTPVTGAPLQGTNQPSAKPDRDLAVSLMRQQINQLYDAPAATTPSSPQPQPLENAYDRTHDESQPHDVNVDQWQRYHTAWQQYYQQYYERYYLAQAHARQQRRVAPEASGTTSTPQFAHTAPDKPSPQGITKDAALSEIKDELTSKIHAQTKKIRRSRHFIPVISALAVMSVFLFLQFESVIASQIRYYVSPGSIKAQDIILDASSSTKVSDEPRIVIPKINVDAPVVYDVSTWEEAPVQAGLKRGVVHYNLPGASANPGEKGNAAFLGHSSGSVFNDNPYKFIFVQLEQLGVGDKFYLNYRGTRYTYLVTKTETILPSEVAKLIAPPAKPTATLITCTPVGTNYKRFVVYADQISPDPNAAVATDKAPDTNPPAAISGNEPTLFERLFGL
ncbi:MAG: class E sortase [Candidatus Saccharimonadales bacterium]